MLRLLQIFLLLLVGNLFNSQHAVIVELHAEIAASSITPAEQKQSSDFGYFKAAEQEYAVVNNQRNNVRTSTIRTFRTTSPNGTTKWRCSGGAFTKYYNNLLTSKRWREALRIESAPFRFSCPCDYYVIALRHIIR